MTELKPCPFCGGNAKFARIAGEGTEAVCLECHCGTPKYFSVSENPDTEKEMAAQVWNKRTPGWISVKDRLPDIDKKSEVPGWSKEVIGYHRQYGIVFCYCRISTREWMLSKSCHITSKITHWMPLPEPPEGESES